MRRELEPKDQKPTWTEEEFYFGNAGTPSWAIYRNSGERLQLRIEMPLSLEQTKPDSSRYEADLEGENPWGNTAVIDFLKQYQDCKIIVHDSYPGSCSENRVPPKLWLIGWQEVTTPEGRLAYEQDKINGRWKTEAT